MKKQRKVIRKLPVSQSERQMKTDYEAITQIATTLVGATIGLFIGESSGVILGSLLGLLVGKIAATFMKKKFVKRSKKK